MLEPVDAGPSESEVTEFDPAPRRLIGIGLTAALLLEIGLRGGVTNAVVSAGLALVVVLLLIDRRVQRREARVLAATALVPAAFLVLRASPWLAASNLAAGSGLVLTAVLYSRAGSVFDATPRQVLQRGLAAMERGVAGLAVVRVVTPRLNPRDLDRLARVARALVVAVPVLAVLVALLASADAVFASLLTPDVDASPLLGHLLLTLLAAAVVLCLAASTSAPATDRRQSGGFGVVEVATMLALAAAVLGLFVVSQLVALTDAGRRLVQSAGLTPAEYARSGFFQLCWATGLVLAFLGLVRSLAAPEALQHRAVRALGGAVPILAVGLVVVSLRRMALYDSAFGLTMLRLWVIGAALWMMLLLVMTAARSVGLGSGRDWLAAGAGIAAVTLVLIADIANPEAFVVHHNVGRADEGADLDIGYLGQLSDDAVPSLAGAIDAEDDVRSRARLVNALRCTDGRSGVAVLNVAAARAADVRHRLCPT